MHVVTKVIDSCDSTNRVAREMALEGVPHGSWVSALEQSQGRGRLERSWTSSRGNLFLSIILRPNLDQEKFLSWIPLMVGVSVYQAVSSYFSGSSVKLKWPNDIWIGDLKIAGILCESASRAIVPGIGINLTSAPEGAGCLSDFLSHPPTLEDLRGKVIAEVVNETRRLSSDSIFKIRENFERNGLFQKGNLLEWENSRQGHFIDLGENGELLVSEVGKNSNQPVSLFAEDVRKVRKI